MSFEELAAGVLTLSQGERRRLRAIIDETLSDEEETAMVLNACNVPYYPLDDCHEAAAAVMRYLDDPEGEP